MSLRQRRRKAFCGPAGHAHLRAAIASAWLGLLLLDSAAAYAQARCPQRAALAASVEGRVEMRADPQAPWQALRPGDEVCVGYAVRVLERSRAALRLLNDVL